MAKYTGKTVTVAASAASITEKFADLTVLNNFIDQLPDSERQKIGQVSFDTDAINIVNPQIGQLTFRVVERSEKSIKLSASAPLAMTMDVELTPTQEINMTDVTTVIDIAIPAMLKPMLSPHLQKAADQFGTLMAKIALGNGI